MLRFVKIAAVLVKAQSSLPDCLMEMLDYQTFRHNFPTMIVLHDISVCFFRYFEEHDGTITLLEEKKNSVVRIGPGNPSVWHLSKSCSPNISCRFHVAAKSGPAVCRKLFLLKPQIKQRYSEHQCC